MSDEDIKQILIIAQQFYKITVSDEKGEITDSFYMYLQNAGEYQRRVVDTVNSDPDRKNEQLKITAVVNTLTNPDFKRKFCCEDIDLEAMLKKHLDTDPAFKIIWEKYEERKRKYIM